MTDQAESELRTFHQFIDLAQLRVVSESVEKREPPEPDVLCRFENGGLVAFELVEVCKPTNARFLFSAHQIHRLIMSVYHRLPPHVCKAFDQRFVDVPLSFSFRREASLAVIRHVLPSLLAELASACEGDAEYINFSPNVATVVVKVRQRGKLNDPGEVNFNLGGHFDPTVPLDAVAAKLSKRYRVDCPIELLAHFGAHAWGHDRSYREAFLTLVKQNGLGPFRRIWVMDWRGIGLVVPSLSRDDMPPNIGSADRV